MLAEWFIIAGFTGIGLICLTGAVCATVWAIQDRTRRTR